MQNIDSPKQQLPKTLPSDLKLNLHYNLSDLEVPDFVLSQLKVHINNVPYEILVNKKPKANKLLVFGQSALSNRMAVSLPTYHRWTWFEDFPGAHCIALNDPTLYLDDSMIGGWFQGHKDNFYVYDAVALISDIAQKLTIKPSNIFFYGSSAGGFSSLLMAGLLKGATAIAEIPQTDMRKWHVKAALNSLLKNCYGDESLDSASKNYAYRMSVVEFYKKINNVPNILLLQNCADSIHLKNHFIPFVEEMEDLLNNSNSCFQTEFYSARNEKGDGHVAAPRGWVGARIRDAFNKYAVN